MQNLGGQTKSIMVFSKVAYTAHDVRQHALQKTQAKLSLAHNCSSSFTLSNYTEHYLLSHYTSIGLMSLKCVQDFFGVYERDAEC